MHRTSVTHLLAAGLLLIAAGCDDTCEHPEDEIGGGAALGLVRGHVRFEDGAELERLTVRAGSQSARTDREGYFELEVPSGESRRVHVDSDEFTGGEAVVQVRADQDTSLELSLLRMRKLQIDDAAKGGRLEDDQGFALELPAGSLRKRDGSQAKGEAELRYGLVREAGLMGVPPEMRGRNGSNDDVRLQGQGMFEARFYQGEERLEFEGEASAEVPLPPGSRLRDGDRVDVYHYEEAEGRWQRETEAEIRDGKWLAKLGKFSWWAAAEAVEDLACIRVELRTPDDEPASGSVIEALGSSALWSSEAVIDEDGQACIEAPAGTDLLLSAFWESAEARGRWSSEASAPEQAGMCGGDECAELGEQTLEGGPILVTDMDAGMPEDGGADASSDAGADAFVAPPLLDRLMETATTTMPGEALRFTFSALGGERLAYTIEGTTATVIDAEVLDPEGNRVANSTRAASGGSRAFSDEFRLPEMEGVYTLEVVPRSGGEGSVTVDLFGVPEDLVEPIEVDGESVELPFAAIGQNGVLTFEAAAGDRLAYTSTSGATAVVDLRVLSAAGTGISGSNDSTSSGQVDNFRDEFTLPGVAGTTGSYTLEINPRGESTGPVSVRLFSVLPDLEETMVVGEALPLMITSVGQNAQVSFEGTANQRLAYYVQNDSDALIDVSLRNSSDIIVGSSGTTASANSTRFRDPFVLLGTGGTYTFTLNPRAMEIGNFSLELLAVPDPASQSTTLGSSGVTVAVGSPGQTAAYTFDASGGETISYDLLNGAETTIDVELLDPNGDTVTGGGGATNGTLTRTGIALPPVAGTYVLEVDPRQDGVGSFTLDLFNDGV